MLNAERRRLFRTLFQLGALVKVEVNWMRFFLTRTTNNKELSCFMKINDNNVIQLRCLHNLFNANAHNKQHGKFLIYRFLFNMLILSSHTKKNIQHFLSAETLNRKENKLFFRSLHPDLTHSKTTWEKTQKSLAARKSRQFFSVLCSDFAMIYGSRRRLSL